MGESNVVPLPFNEKSCHVCLDTTDFHLHICQRCKKWHCIEHSSKANPLFCQDCMIDVTVTEESFQRVTEDWDEQTDKLIVTKTQPIKQISLSGADWVFQNKVIREMSEEELKISIQFFRASVSAMEAELTQKQIKRITSVRINGAVVSNKITEVKTTKTSKVQKPVNLNDLAEKMKKLNLTPEQIKSILGM